MEEISFWSYKSSLESQPIKFLMVQHFSSKREPTVGSSHSHRSPPRTVFSHNLPMTGTGNWKIWQCYGSNQKPDEMKYDVQNLLLLQNVSHEESVTDLADLGTEIAFLWLSKSGLEKLLKTVSCYILGVPSAGSRKVASHRCRPSLGKPLRTMFWMHNLMKCQFYTHAT